jgi:hypothetical protein
MAKGTLTTDTWQECEVLRDDLARARRQITCAADCLRHALNPKERARDFMHQRPGAAILTTLAAGAIAARLLPALIWRRKGGLFRRFTGELVKGAAGAALPVIANRFSASFKARRHPNSFVLERHDPVVL